MRRTIALARAWVIGSVLMFAGCQPPPSEELKQIQEDQKLILAKLADIEKKLDRVPARPAAPPTPSGPDASKKHDIPVGESIPRGPANAPVSIVEFSDYQCPFCARTEPLIKQVLQEYPKEVNFVYKHFPLTSIHPQAMGAAKAAVAAGKQGKFWEMHDLLFEHQRELQPEKLKEYATKIGLDVAKFEADMNSPEVQKIVQDDMMLAQRLQIRGTPTIFVGGKLLQDRSVEGIKALVEEALKEKKQG